MADKRPDDGRIGKEIDWSLLIPSSSRPTWEPPALEALDYFEKEHDFSLNLRAESMKKEFPDDDVRLRVVDLPCEEAPLYKYEMWANDQLDEAEESEDDERLWFYIGLLEALEEDADEVKRG